jgi:ketol-acid reductoisomerase
MASMYIVQCFQLRGRKLVADQPKTARTSEAAIELAERLGGAKAGAVAFSQEVDIETDTYDEPRVLYRVGTLPAGLFEEQ